MGRPALQRMPATRSAPPVASTRRPQSVQTPRRGHRRPNDQWMRLHWRRWGSGHHTRATRASSARTTEGAQTVRVAGLVGIIRKRETHQFKDISFDDHAPRRSASSVKTHAENAPRRELLTPPAQDAAGISKGLFRHWVFGRSGLLGWHAVPVLTHTPVLLHISFTCGAHEDVEVRNSVK
jgi:hypothetical protein